jgi:hypothetical protein
MSFAFSNGPRAPARAAADWLGEDQAFARLHHDAQRLSAIHAALSRATGGLDIRPVRLDEGTLCVTVTGPAMAARLRQVEPSTVSALRQDGWAVAKLRIRARPAAQPPAPPPTPRQPIPPAVRQALATLAERVSDAQLQAGLRALVHCAEPTPRKEKA